MCSVNTDKKIKKKKSQKGPYYSTLLSQKITCTCWIRTYQSCKHLLKHKATVSFLIHVPLNSDIPEPS